MMNFAVPFDDGSTHTFCSRQRPQLFFSEAAGLDGVQRGRPGMHAHKHSVGFSCNKCSGESSGPPLLDNEVLVSAVVLFTGAQHGENTDNTSLCGITNGNTSEYNPYVFF